MADSMNPEPAPWDVHHAEVPASAGRTVVSADMVRLALRVEEFERRLKARTLELETEIRSKERLRARVTELTKRADELQATAAALHREAVSATALSRELDETLRVASEARRQLGEALAAERARRETAEKDLVASLASTSGLRESAEAEHKCRDAELKDARLHLQALRQKANGQEAHIESLRAELEAAREQAGDRANAELESLKAELRDRADRESRELRDALEGERARLYQDLDAERRALAAGAPAEDSAERVKRLRAESDERREGIAREVQAYLSPEPKAGNPALPSVADVLPAVSAPAAETPDPARRQPWQTRDELKFLFWIAAGAFLAALFISTALLFRG